MGSRDEQIAALKDARKIQLDEYRSASSAVLRYQVTRLLFMLLIVALALGQKDLLPVRPDEPRIALNSWVSELKKSRPWILDLPYSSFSHLSQKVRSDVTDTIRLHMTPEPNDKVGAVYTALVRAWGFDPIRLPDADAFVGDLKTIPRTKTWKDVKGLRRAASDKTLEARAQGIFESSPYLKVPLDDAATVDRIVDAMSATLRSNVDDYRLAAAAFQILDANLADWRSWRWEAWDLLLDRDYAEWKVGVLAKFGDDEEVALEKTFAPTQPVAMAVNIASRQAAEFAAKQQKAAEQKVEDADVSLSLFSVSLKIPHSVLLLLFCLSPMLFVLSAALLRMLQLRQRLSAVQLARVEGHLADLVGVEFVGLTVDPEVTSSRVEWDYLKSREWGKLFQNDPELFTDVFFMVANASLVIVLVSSVMRVVMGLHDHRKIVLLVLSAAIGLALEALSRRVAADALQHALGTAAARPTEDEKAHAAA